MGDAPTGYCWAVILWNWETMATKRALFIIHIHTHGPPVNHSLTLNWIDTHGTTFQRTFRIPPTYELRLTTTPRGSSFCLFSVTIPLTKSVPLQDVGPVPANQWAQTRVSCPHSLYCRLKLTRLNKLYCGSHHFYVSRVYFLIYTT